MKPNVETMIEDLVNSTVGNKSLREKHLFREALRNLARLAKAEQMLEIKTSVKKLTGALTTHASRRKAKIDRLLRGARATESRQRQLEFEQVIPVSMDRDSEMQNREQQK